MLSKIFAIKNTLLNRSLINKFITGFSTNQLNEESGLDLDDFLLTFFTENYLERTLDHTLTTSLVAGLIFENYIKDPQNLKFLQNITNVQISNIKTMISICAKLHDIGKIGIPCNILYKKKPLDSLEKKLIRSHTLVGSIIIQYITKSFVKDNIDWKVNNNNIFTTLHTVVMRHHERPDGLGYPGKIKYLIKDLA
ncbi:MAG: hypothetical protein KKA19_01075, partial [Candidatus Margulisbacteria bacterium]|nr:hypothetical protein [Candidatus Margulisiibacteriota bacterium]